MAAIGEVRSILQTIVESGATLDPIIPGKLVPGKQIGVVEHEALRVLVWLDGRDDFARPNDELRDWCQRLCAPRVGRDKWVAVFEADPGHAARKCAAIVRCGEKRRLTRIGDGARAIAAGVGDGSG